MRDLTESYPEIKAALHNACEQFAERVDHYYGGMSDGAVNEISAASYDGFIAHTNGGFRVTVPCTLRDVEAEGLTDFERAILQPYIDRCHIDAAEHFVENHDTLSELWDLYQESDGDKTALEWFEKRISDAEDLHRAQPDMFGKVDFWQTETGYHVEEFHECVSEWMTEGGTFFYELRAIFYEKDHHRNATGADEVYIFAGINTDFEYGREKGLECAIERDYKLERLTPARINAIVEHFGGKL